MSPASQCSDDSSLRTADSQATRAWDVLQSIVIGVNCGRCWAYPRRECVILPCGPGPFPLHAARYERAHKKGLITDAELVAAIAVRGERDYVIWPELVKEKKE